MTKLEKLQEEYIDVLADQVADLSMMSKIELGGDVLTEIGRLQGLIKKASNSVPFVEEVKEFNVLMGKEFQNRTYPEINQKDADFVVNFIQEELDEMKVAVANNDIVGILDAILDITYVCLGNGALVFGLEDKILPGYAEVQASNLSKVCKTEEIAKATVELRSEQSGEECHYEKVGDNYIVYRSRDMKVQKSIDYFAPNLNQFFSPQEIENCELE